MKKLIILSLLTASVWAGDITITLTLTDAQQAAYARVQTRETDTNLVVLKPSDYVSALLMQSVNGVLKQERNSDVQMLAAKLKAADTATITSVQSTLKVDPSAVIPADVPAK